MIFNNTRFAVGQTLHQWAEAAGAYEAVTLVVKATFSLSGDGLVELAEDQIPVRYADELTGERDDAPSARLPADVVLEKAGTDVIVAGHAYLPPGNTEVITAVQVGDTTAPLRVHGPRLFESGLGGVRIGPAVHVDRVALTYERAYGGVSSDLQQTEGRNPAGVGVSSSPRELDGKLAPQIEHPTRPHTSAKDTHAPMGYAPLLPFWEPRRSAFGTLDDAYTKRRLPLPPVDFSCLYNNQAHPSLILSAPLSAKTTIALSGLRPEGLLRFELPTWGVSVVAHRDRGVDPGLILRPDTVVIEPDVGRLELVGRVRLRLLRKNLLREVQIDEASE
ncbi:MAG: DUF2169 domain-containing protein [Polyangiaceae bacterium]